jgi:L-seryl-tRNA(Ser) seleniumtransferase
MDPRRMIPSIDGLLASQAFARVVRDHPRGRVVHHLRTLQEELRRRISDGEEPSEVASQAWWARAVEERLATEDLPSLHPVINATGVVLHTNLGRAPLAAEALEAMTRAGRGYSNLEYDLREGRRGSRYVHCADLLAELAGAEAGLVVNNAAAALMLALNTVARGRGVVVSRGELVEIGGGFRIPEILERSGARLVEVGSTNRTRTSDYAEAALEQDVAAFLKVHRSNFRMTGFTEDAPLEALAELGRTHGLPLLFDLGSGLFVDPATLGLPPEPRPLDALAQGADLVVVSGDKLFGGPQAGIAVGRKTLIEAMRANPLCRALRVDKATLAGLEATARLYRDPVRALERIPTLRMLAYGTDELRPRADLLAARLGEGGVADVAVEPTRGAVGGGTYPEVALGSWGVVLSAWGGPHRLAAALRMGDPPVVARIEDDRLVLDVRTVDPAELETLVDRILDATATEDE